MAGPKSVSLFFSCQGIKAYKRRCAGSMLRAHRAKVREVFGELPRYLVGIEACPSAHHWGREREAPGVRGHRAWSSLIRLAGYQAIFKDDTNIVPTPPRELAFSDCEKVVERDVEVYRKEAQSICMHYGVRSAKVVSNNAQFSAAFKEQQAIRRMFDHVQSNRYVWPRWLWYFWEQHL